MILFFTKPGEAGEQIQQEINIDALEVVSENFVISIRKSGIRARKKNMPLVMGGDQEEDIVLDTNLDLT